MPMPHNRSKYKRTDHFLLRVWCEEPESDGDGGSEEKPGSKWYGRVQRTVSGEAYNFEDKAALIEVLEAMLFKDQS